MKYVLVPDGERLTKLYKQLEISDAERASLVLLAISQIVVDSRENTWEIQGQGELAEDVGRKVAGQLANLYGLSRVNFVIAPAVIKAKTEKAPVVQEESPSVPGTKVAELITESNLVPKSDAQVLQPPLAEQTLARTDEVPLSAPDLVEDKNEEEFQKAYAALYKPKQKGLLFGKTPKGKVRSIGEITEEMNHVVIEGEFVRTVDKDGELQKFDEKELRTGFISLTFNVADETNGIYVRMRFPTERSEGDLLTAARKECKEFKDRLKPGMRLRIQGNAAPDKFLFDEMALLPQGIMVVPVAERKDEAPQKRVELHCHTKMSKMDAVTPMEDLVKKAMDWGHSALAITDHGVVQAFPFCADALEEENADRKARGLEPSPLKLIYGMEGYLPGEENGDGDDLDQELNEEEKKAKKKKIPNYHIIFLAKNETGLRNLYKMVTISHLQYIQRNPLLPRKIIEEHREGILVGSACEAGELYRSILRGASDEELEAIAAFYDYLEIQPLGNNMFLVRSQKCTEEDLKNYNRKIYALGKKLGKLVVATGDVHFLNPEDAKVRAVLQAAQKYRDADQQAPLYYRTTEEMLEEFEYLGQKEAEEVVITNPQKIADMVERFNPVPGRDKLYSPHIDGAEEAIKSMAYAKAKSLYGDPLPQLVEDRLALELNSIIGHGFAVLYYIAHKLVKRSLEINYLVGSRGSVGSSFVATMIDITEVNSLPPHYRCPKCRHTEFFTHGEYDSGFDLAPKDCPECGTAMVRDGHDIPFAVFMGFNGDKVPDIDLNFSEVAQHYAHEYTKELFGRDNVCRAGTISTVAVRTAIGYCKGYFEGKNLHAHPALIASIVQRLQGVKKTTGQHPGGIMVVPRDMDIHYITPMNYPSNEKKMKVNILGEMDPPTITTHYDYHSINDRLVKLDILGHDDPGMIRHLEDIIPGLNARDIPVGDPGTMALFTGTESLGVTPEQIGSPVGTFGVPECGTQFVRQMIADVKPTKFSDVVRISGYSHGTDVWLNNAQDLIKAGKPVKQTISTRDDVMLQLIQAGVDRKIAFDTMEYVRKGKAAKKGLQPKMREAMEKAGVPEWYMKSCETCNYLFPKAHAVAYVLMAYRIAYCKVHYPKQFYAAYFTERADLFDATMIAKGKDYIKEFIKTTNELGFKAEKLAKNSLPYLELVVEMLERGLQFEPLDLYKSDAIKFLVTDKGLRLPLATVPGVGTEAAKALERAISEAKKTGELFLSREDLAERSGVGPSVVEKLAEVGALGDLPASNAISLFD